jgi:hypothetical protein
MDDPYRFKFHKLPPSSLSSGKDSKTSGIVFEAVKADLFAVLQPDLVLGCTFAADFTDHSLKKTGFLRQLEFRLAESEHIVYGSVKDVILPRRAVHFAGHRFQHGAQTPARFPVVKAESHFAGAMIDQIAFAHGATCDDLHRINAAGVVFRDTNNFFVWRKLQTQLFDGGLTRPKSDGKSRALMSMKSYAFFPQFLIHTNLLSDKKRPRKEPFHTASLHGFITDTYKNQSLPDFELIDSIPQNEIKNNIILRHDIWRINALKDQRY